MLKEIGVANGSFRELSYKCRNLVLRMGYIENLLPFYGGSLKTKGKA